MVERDLGMVKDWIDFYISYYIHHRKAFLLDISAICGHLDTYSQSWLASSPIDVILLPHPRRRRRVVQRRSQSPSPYASKWRVEA